MNLKTAGTSQELQIGMDGNGHFVKGLGVHDLVMSTANTERMRISGTNGNVGIGTTSPNAPLQFANTVANRKIVLFDDMNNDHQYFGFGINGNTLRYQVNQSIDSHVFYSGINSTSSKELMRIQGNGNVGIGTSSPGSKFQVGTSGNSISLDNTAVGSFGAVIYIDSTGGSSGRKYSIFSSTANSGGGAGKLSFFDESASQYRMVIDSGGNVGIGTTNPSQKLGVSGNCHISGQCIIGATDNANNYALKVTNGGSLIDGGLLINNSSTVNGGLVINGNGSIDGTFFIKNTTANDTRARSSLTENSMLLPYALSGSNLYFYGRDSDGVKRSHIITMSAMFTGQHCNIPADPILKTNIRQYEGMIVSSTGSYSSLNNQTKSLITGKDAITITESLPIIKLTDKDMDKSVWGVITNVKNENYKSDGGLRYDDDTEWDQGLEDRIRINGLGEGSIWVININGAIENGDYICSSSIPGYGRKQDDDILHNYTVAKITMDCAFDLTTDKYVCEEITHNGTTYIRAFVGCTYHCS